MDARTKNCWIAKTETHKKLKRTSWFSKVHISCTYLYLDNLFLCCSFSFLQNVKIRVKIDDTEGLENLQDSIVMIATAIHRFNLDAILFFPNYAFR